MTTNPAVPPYDYEIFGRIEFSQICGGNTSGNITGEPGVTDRIIPALLKGYGNLTNDGSVVSASLDITCFGEEEPRISAISVEYQLSDSGTTPILKEVPVFRPNSPIYLFRISYNYNDSNMDSSAGSSCAYQSRCAFILPVMVCFYNLVKFFIM